MARHDELNSIEAADRLAIRELFDAYAHCADTRDAAGQKALFLEDCTFAVYMSGEGTEPTYVINSREGLTSVFADLNQYSHTMHFNGQSTVVLDGNRATGDSYTIAHHLSGEGSTALSWSPTSATSTRTQRSTGPGSSPNAGSSWNG